MRESKEYNPVIGAEVVVAMTVTASPRKPTFLQGKKWRSVQEAKHKCLSIRGMARELRPPRETVRRYIDAESPPTRRSPATSTETPSDTITD